MRWLLMTVVAVVVSCANASSLRIVQDRIGRSKMILKTGDEIALKVPIQNAGAQAFRGDCAIRWAVRGRGRDSVSMPRVVAQLAIEPDRSADMPVTWRPAANGWHQIDFTIEGVADGHRDDAGILEHLMGTLCRIAVSCSHDYLSDPKLGGSFLGDRQSRVGIVLSAAFEIKNCCFHC